MKIEITEDIVRVTDLPELGERQAAAFQAEVSAALPACPGLIEVDLGQTTHVDYGGLAALVVTLDQAQQRNREATLRVVDPSPPVRQLLELTRLHRIFAVVERVPAGPS
ncbi:STAS domain-containing protein [Opitutus sp. GAS368]|uniref:STAS domain-containing protein n=1 Tax=Opitutus sp. GAS368 TaxID=1882749 RepID=UPI00087B5AC7|nr:STAS domain-containing protein [Opitutus sp. GAS368]SDS41510.1 anti-sigma B factor antagonist [Opitutus sp. GAS368]